MSEPTAEQKLDRLLLAIRPILGAYRSEPAHITDEQITFAWGAYDAIRKDAEGLVKSRCCLLTASQKHQPDCPRVLYANASERVERLEGALRELDAYLRIAPDQDHRRHGEACGQDACILCLCESIAREALDSSTPGGERSNG